MAQSTDALLMFGVNLGDGEDIEWPEALVSGEEGASYPDLDEWIAKRAGLIEPTGDDYKTPEWSAYFAAKRAAVETMPVELVSHCSGDSPMWVIALRRTVQRARRGHPKVSVMDEIDRGDIAVLRAFCDETGLPFTEPRWLLCSDWS